LARMTGGQAVVRSLEAEGLNVVFGVPGAYSLYIYDALLDCPGVRHILTRHEQGAAFMADGYARASRQIGVCLTVNGPGVTNAFTAIAQAYSDSSPVLSITSQVNSKYIDQGKGILHELKDQPGVFEPITAQSQRLTKVAHIPEAIHSAVRMMRTQRPRPIHLEVPVDVLAAVDKVEILEGEAYEREGSHPAAVEEAVQRLMEAQKLLIYAGGGVSSSGASPELLRLAELFQSPVLTSGTGKGVIPEDHPLAFGLSWSPRVDFSEIVQKADVVLAVGTRFTATFTTDWTLPFPKQLIQIDIDEGEIGKNYPVQVGLVGDAKKTLQQILKSLDKKEIKPRLQFLAEMQEWKRRTRQELKKANKELPVLEEIRAALPRDTIICGDMMMFWVETLALFPVYEPGTFLFPWGYGTIGFSFPAAIGAKVACPERPVVAMCGDGAFMYTCQELATAVKYGISVPVILFNDNCYANIKQQQMNHFDRCSEADLVNPDFVKFAESFGAYGIRIEDLGDLKPAIEKSLEADGPTIIEVPRA
jgi:thiamine pyrophosphate-dependent acetolactate synthase large subunit-like protein